MWVKLTRTNGNPVYINMERFDKVEVVKDNNDDDVTRISSCLSEVDDDIAMIDVVEMPEVFMSLMMK